MSELESRIKNTLGRDSWPKFTRDGETIIQYPGQREYDIVAHYEREIDRGRLTVVQAYEKACSDCQGRNGHATEAQRGKRYSMVTVNIQRGE